MAGWLISLKAGPKDELKFVKFYFENRLYGYRFPREKPKKRWASAQWNTIADFSLFEVGDLIFFFCKRNIYGIGKVIEPTKGYGDNPVLCNYRGCLLPENTLDNPSICLWDEQFRRGLWSEKEKLESDIRLIVFFEPCPAFFTTGLDMDFVLQSDIGGIARQIRTFEGVGFIKLEEGDVDVLVELFTRNTGNNTPGFPSDEETHKRIKGILLKDEGGRYRFDPHILFEKYSDNGLFDQEGLLQIAIAHGLTTGSNNVNGVLGNWDYICNQVKVSPLKPVSYMDKADIFGLSHKSLNKQRLRSAVDRFLIAELKKDSFETAKPGTQRAEKIKNAFSQTMKYVDWVANYRAGGDYSLISAALIAGGFPAELIAYVGTHRKRDYIIPRRPYEAKHWANLKLVEYSVFNGEVLLKEIRIPA